MSRIVMKPLRSKKQLRKIAFKDVVASGFTDDTERFFVITFDAENGEKIDLSVVFETRTPRVYVSDSYTE